MSRREAPRAMSILGAFVAWVVTIIPWAILIWLAIRSGNLYS